MGWMNHLLQGAVQSPQKRPIFFRAFSATCISVLNIDIVLCLVVVLHRIINTLRWSVPDPTQWSNPIQFTKVKSLLLIEQHWPSSRYWYCRGPPQCGPIVLEKKIFTEKVVTGFKSTQSRHFIHSHHLNCFASSPKCLIDILLSSCLAQQHFLLMSQTPTHPKGSGSPNNCFVVDIVHEQLICH